MKEVIKINNRDIKQRMAIFKRFMTELNLWPRWKRYIAKTPRASCWITGPSITCVTRNVDFSGDLLRDYYIPMGIGYFYFTEVLEVFLRLFTDYGRAAIRQEERYADRFNLTLKFYTEHKKNYNPKDHYQMCGEETLKALCFLDKLGVLDKWLKESPFMENGQIKQKTTKNESRYRHTNRIRTEITPDIFL